MTRADSTTTLTSQTGENLRESPNATTTVSIACCADNNYAMGLAVTLASAAIHLHSGARLSVELFDDGISETNRERLERTCERHAIRYRWRYPDLDCLRGLPVSHHISRAAYLRLLLGDSLSEMQRVLYLDSDLLIRDDLSRLFQWSLEGHVCGAITDGGCPVMDAWKGLPNVAQCGPYLSVYRPIRNYRQLGFSPSQPYFNSGVLLIDLDAWRRERIAEQALQCLHDHRRFVWCWDQYALNVVLAHQWLPLPLRWNCGAHLLEYPDAESGPFESHECRAALEAPGIVHFTTDRKPWLFGVVHPYRDEFFATLDQTAWEGWRPTPAPFTLRRWVIGHVARLRKQATISGRKALLRVAPPRPPSQEMTR